MATYLKGTFTIDGEATFEGYTSGDDWNGWECPVFEKEAAQAVCAWLTTDDPDGWTFEYKADLDYFTGDDENWYGLDIDTLDGQKHVYAIGAYAYVWQLA